MIAPLRSDSPGRRFVAGGGGHTGGHRRFLSALAGHDDGQYVRDAENAGQTGIARFFRDVMEQDSQRAATCHQLLKKLSGTEAAGPAAR